MSPLWLPVCQGLVLLGWLWRLFVGVARAHTGAKIEPTGGIGVFAAVLWGLLSALVIWRSGALSTIFGAP